MNVAATHLCAEHPFPGLRPFDFADCQFFFGREQQVNALYRLLDFSRFVAVVGSSGSGKSSLVRAGLLPQLQQEAEHPGGRRWRFVTMHPGDAPTEALADALSSLVPQASSRDRILECLQTSSFGLVQARDVLTGIGSDPIFLIVDQFEELFRYAAFAAITRENQIAQTLWRDRAGHFVELLLEATRSRSAEIFVLITIRSDFIGDCAQFPDLPEAVSAGQFLVPGLTRDQRESIIRRPIEKASETIAGATIEPALVQRLHNDIGDELDQLPVLQHCLSRLWEHAGATHHLVLEHYDDIGKIADSLSQHADEIMAELPGLEVAVEQLFRALSEVDKEGRATRRAVPYGQLCAECGVPEEQLRTVIDRFRADDCSFLVPSIASVPRLRPDTRIDVGHEALLRHWKKISQATESVDDQQGWLWEEDRDGRRYRALLVTLDVPLAQAVAYSEWWERRPRTAAWGERYGGQFACVNQLIADSRDKFFARQRKEQLEVQNIRALQHRRMRQVLLFAVAMGIIALVAVIFGISAHVAQQRADAAEKAVRTEEVAADATLGTMEEMIAMSQHPGATLNEQRKDDEKYQEERPALASPRSSEQRTLAPIAGKLEPVLYKAYGGTVPFAFYAIKDLSMKDPGAYAFYGPRVYVSTAMIKFAHDREQLAGIICHVSAHIVNHSGSAEDRLAARPGTPVQFALDRAEEEAADLTGAVLCKLAGYNPWGLDRLLRKLHDHPAFGEVADSNRIAVLEKFLRRLHAVDQAK